MGVGGGVAGQGNAFDTTSVVFKNKKANKPGKTNDAASGLAPG